jgi:hypothetical protein
MAIGESA